MFLLSRRQLPLEYRIGYLRRSVQDLHRQRATDAEFFVPCA